MNPAYNIADFGMDTATLAGGLAQKLAAIRAAGFSQVLLTARELVNHPEGFDAAVRIVKQSGLRVAGFQMLRDYEGLRGHLHDYKVDVAKSLLEMCAAVGADLLLVAATTAPHAAADADHVARDLRKLAMLAVPSRVRIGYKPLPWAHHVRDLDTASDLVFQADAPNLGLVIDTFQLLSANAAPDDLELLDPDKIFLVQLADFAWQDGEAAATGLDGARRFQVFPGEGMHSRQLADLVVRLSRLGYRGAYGFDVCNDDYAQLPIPTVADRARRAALWLGEDVLHLSTPLPGRMRLRAR